MDVVRILVLLGLLAAPAAAQDLLAESAARDAAAEPLVQSLLVNALREDPDATRADVAAIRNLDDARRAAGQAPSGLADDARYLAAGLQPTRDTRRAALEALLDDDPDKRITRIATHLLESDEGARGGQLLSDDRHNRRAQLVNEAIRPLGVFSPVTLLAAVNPFLLAGSALDSVATTAVNLWNYNRLSREEREALVRYKTGLAQSPDTSDAPEMARAVRALGAKRARALCDGTLDLGTDALDDDDLEHARFYLGSAAQLDGCGDRARAPRDKLQKALAAREKSEEAGRWPANDPLMPKPEETDDYAALLHAVASGDPTEVDAASRTFLAAHPKSTLVPGARYAAAMAADAGGRRADARDTLDDLADEDSALGRHSQALLESPEWNRLDALAAAERSHTKDVAKYVVLGGVDGRSTLYTAARLGASSGAAGPSLGIANVLGMMTRAYQAWRRDPASNQKIIDRGEELLAREPNSPDAADVHARLADAYERDGNYARALLHLRALPDPKASRIEDLENKLADRMLEDAGRHGDDPVRLGAVVQYLGDTKAAATARAKLEKASAGGLTVSREVLAAAPSVAGPSGLAIDPALLDGDEDNGELADAGVTLRDRVLVLSLVGGTKDDPRTESVPLDPEAYARARAAAVEALYTRLVTAEQRNPEAGRFEHYIPVYLQGSIDEGGNFAISPGIKLRRTPSANDALYR